MAKLKKKSCPKCIGIGEIFNGKTVKSCSLCEGTGEVDNSIKYDPIEDEINIGFNDM